MWKSEKYVYTKLSPTFSTWSAEPPPTFNRYWKWLVGGAAVIFITLSALGLYHTRALHRTLIQPHQAYLHSPLLYENVSLKVPIGEPTDDGDYPPFFTSEKYTPLQLRAMLEKDLVEKGLSFDLNKTQLETIKNTTIIIASFNGHLDQLTRFMRSMIRHCVDCDRFQIDVVLYPEDIDLFEERLFAEDNKTSIGHFLPGLRLVDFSQMEMKYQPNQLRFAENLKRSGKLPIQSYKKMYGCLTSGKAYCSLLDSESFFVRTTNYSDLVKEYLDDPFIIHNSDFRRGDNEFTAFANDIVAYTDPDTGWLLEYYMWIMDASIMDTVASITADHWEAGTNIPNYMMVEVVYYAHYLEHHPPRENNAPPYRLIDVKEITGDRFYEYTYWRCLDEDRFCLGLFEDLRVYLEYWPGLIPTAADFWDAWKLRYYKAGNNFADNTLFLDRAKGLKLCVSEQPLALYETAMMGMFNEK